MRDETEDKRKAPKHIFPQRDASLKVQGVWKEAVSL